MAESVTLLKVKNRKSKEHLPSLQLKPELHDTKDMETGNDQGKASITADKTTKANDKTTKEAGANANYNQSQNSKTSSKGIAKNKNVFLRKSKSCLEMRNMKEETMPHSESFCGQPLHSCSSQVSIPECDGENTNLTAQCNTSLLTITEKITHTNDKNDTSTTTEDTRDVHNSSSFSNLKLFGNQQKLHQKTENDRKLQYHHQQQQHHQQHKSQQQQSPLNKQQQQINQQQSKQQSSQDRLQLHHKQPNRHNLPQKQPQQLSNDQQKMQQQRQSQFYLPDMKTITISTATAVISTSTIITTVAKTSTTDTIATSTTTAETPTTAETAKQQQPLSPLNLKIGSPEKHQQSPQALVKGFRSPFSPPQYMCGYSKWLPQMWQDTKIDQFHDDQLPLNQLEDEETKANIYVETDLADDILSDDIQSELKTAVCKRDSTNTVSEGSKSEASSNNLSHFATSSAPPKLPPVATTDCKAFVPQKTPPTCTLNNLGSREVSVTENPSVFSASPDVDNFSIHSSSSSAQFSSMQSSANLSSQSSQSSVTSMDSSTLLIKSSSSSRESPTSSIQLSTSIPLAIISPTTGTSVTKEKKKDFILLHADADQEDAQQCRDHLKQDIGIHDLTVDLFSEIDSGQTAMMSLETLHDRYNNILVLGTKNLADDKFSRFLNENILTKGLQDANGKEDRVVPVWTSSDCKSIITEFRIIKGFQYYHFLSDKSSLSARCYIQCVRTAVKEGRKRIG